MNNSQEHEYVDLGLPSGTLWATCNVGASRPEDYGDYFAWGETKTKSVYDWNTYEHATGNYVELTRYCNNGFTDDNLIELQPCDDPTTANWGNGWYTPKKEQWDELMAHTNREWTTKNGVEGWLFISRRNGKRLFLPAAGYRDGSSLGRAGSLGYYWSSSLDTDDPSNAWDLGFFSGYCGMGSGNRYYGQSVRPVRSAQLDMNCCPEHEYVDLGLRCPELEYVDLGLPSGTLWATCNVGASKPEDYGDYFSWDEGKTAAANWGNGWDMPSIEQWEELKENTKSSWTTRNDVNGRLFTASNGNSLFLPAAGNRWFDELNGAGDDGDYWSSSLDWDTPHVAWGFSFGSDGYGMDYYARLAGQPVRAVRSTQLDMNCCPEHEFVDLGLPSGTLWATCNVGASKPEGYGDYFAWGETKKKDVYDWDTYKHAKGAIDKLTKYCLNKLTKYCLESDAGYNGFADTLAELQPIDDPATANWGNGWFTPKKEQWDELMAHTNCEWTTRNGVKGCLFTSRRNGKSLFLPAAGCRSGSRLCGAGSGGDYWSSSLLMDGPYYAWSFYFDSDGYSMSDNDRRYGFTVRPVRSSRQN